MQRALLPNQAIPHEAVGPPADSQPRTPPMTTSDTTPDIGGPEAGPGGGTQVSGDSGRGILAGLDPHLRRLAVVVVLGSIMSILDTTIVNVAIPTLDKA